IADAGVNDDTPVGNFQDQGVYTPHRVAIRGQKGRQPRDPGEVVDGRVGDNEPHARCFKFLHASNPHITYLPAPELLHVVFSSKAPHPPFTPSARFQYSHVKPSSGVSRT